MQEEIAELFLWVAITVLIFWLIPMGGLFYCFSR